MKKQEDITDLFDNLETIEPSAKWRNELSEKINKAPAQTGKSTAYNLVIGLVVIVLIANVLTIFVDASSNTPPSNDKLKTIASELLISTTSSQF